jgi:hypothetical protein
MILTRKQTREVDNVSMIVGATSGNCGKAIISLWVHKITREKRTRDPPLTWTTFLVATIQIALLLAASGFVYQNLEFGVSRNMLIQSQPYHHELGSTALACGRPGHVSSASIARPEVRDKRSSRD